MGKLLLGWGNVLYDQGHLLRSFELHSRALMRYEATVGDYHNRTGDACVRLSDHLIRFEEYEAAL
jgi:hypothetical protein